MRLYSFVEWLLTGSTGSRARTAFWLLPILLGLGSTACGEITGFCLTAGAPSGVTLVATFTPTPAGNRLTCSLALPDSSGPARRASS